MPELRERFDTVLSGHLPRGQRVGPDWDDDTPLSDRGVDSLRIVGLMTDLEMEFDVVFPDELMTIETFASTRTLWTAVQDLIEVRTG